MRSRRAKAFAKRAADRLSALDIERSHDSRSLYSAHENLSRGASGLRRVLDFYFLPELHLPANGIIEEASLANANHRPRSRALGHVPVYAGRVRGWQQVVIPVEEKGQPRLQSRESAADGDVPTDLFCKSSDIF